MPTAEPGVLFVDPAPVQAAPAAAAMPAMGTGGASPAMAAAIAAAAAGKTGLQMPKASADAVEDPEQKMKVERGIEQLEELETACKEALELSKGGTPATGETELEEVVQAVQTQQNACMEAQKQITETITETKKEGPAAFTCANEMSKLIPHIGQLQKQFGAELMRVKSLLTKKKSDAAAAAKKAEMEANNKEQEEKDSAALQEELPSVKETVAEAEQAADGVSNMAAPLIADPPAEGDESLQTSIAEIEAAAGEAQNKIAEARQQINTKLQTARQYSPETRKNTLTEYTTMQNHLTEIQKKVNPYRTFKKEFQARVQARKSLQDTADKLNAAELEVEKLKMMCHQGMSEDDLTSAEKVAMPAKAGLEAQLRMLEQKMKTAQGAMKDEITCIKERGAEIKKSMDSAMALLQKQRQSVAVKEMLRMAGEKVDKLDESLEKCGQAELPWLKGVEVLPPGESETALKECATALAMADAAMGQARSFIQSKMMEANKLVAEVKTEVAEELPASSSDDLSGDTLVLAPPMHEKNTSAGSSGNGVKARAKPPCKHGTVALAQAQYQEAQEVRATLEEVRAKEGLQNGWRPRRAHSRRRKVDRRAAPEDD